MALVRSYGVASSGMMYDIEDRTERMDLDSSEVIALHTTHTEREYPVYFRNH